MTAHVASPAYTRADLTTGIVHFGVGNFHRSHQAMYLHRLFDAGRARDWAICGVGVLPGDQRMRDALVAQGMRYTLVERSPDGQAAAHTIASIAEYLFAPDDPEAVLEKLADPAVRIVSLTITEGGYNVDDVTGEFDLSRPDVAADLVPGATPRTVFGFVAVAARRRRERGIPPFTVMSCDNLQGNGIVARRSFVTFARALDPELGEWMDREIAFPSSMVDRITPVTGDAERAYVREELGVDDAWPVVCEDFVQWVLEDDFVSGRPPFDEVGVQLVEDVMPYEKMKLRLLNASHQALAYVGYLAGHRLVDDAATDPDLAAFVTGYMRADGEPTLDPVPGVDLADYERTLLERFSNPYIRDTLLRLATDGSDRIAKFVLPVARDLLAAGRTADYCAAVAASWALFARGTDERGAAIEVADRQSALVAEVLRRAGGDPSLIVGDDRLFPGLSGDPRFTEAFVRSYRAFRDRGVRQALAGRDVPVHHEQIDR